jgi:hypothetical protein
MGIDIADLLRLQARVRQRPLHRQLRADAISRRLCDVMGVTGQPVATHLRHTTREGGGACKLHHSKLAQHWAARGPSALHSLACTI